VTNRGASCSGGSRRARIEWGEDGAVVKDEKYNADGSRQ